MGILIASANINSLATKVTYIATLLALNKWDILGLQETKIDSNDSKTISTLPIPGYTLFRRDRSTKSGQGGGVGLYIRTSLSPVPFFAPYKSRSLEITSAKISAKGKSAIIASIYRPPRPKKEDKDAFLDQLSNWLSSLGTDVNKLFLVGDFNICALKPEFDELSSLLSGFGLSQRITQITHGDRLIDHVWMPEAVIGETELFAPIEKNKKTGGHAVTCVSTSFPTPAPPSSRSNFIFRLADWAKATFLIFFFENGSSRELSAEIREQRGVMEAVLYFQSEISKILSNTVPFKVSRPRLNIAPWMTNDLKHFLSRKRGTF